MAKGQAYQRMIQSRSWKDRTELEQHKQNRLCLLRWCVQSSVHRHDLRGDGELKMLVRIHRFGPVLEKSSHSNRAVGMGEGVGNAITFKFQFYL